MCRCGVFLVECCLFVVSSNSPFVTTWKTNSPNESITIPLSYLASSLTVDWGDGLVINISTAPVTHTYNISGLYNVSILGDIYGFSFGSGGDNLKLVDIVSWGDSFFIDSTSSSVFYRCSNLLVSAPPNTQPVFLPNASLEAMFMFSGINSPLDWDLANVTSVAAMFRLAVNLNQPLNFSNTQGVIDTSWMFFGASKFNSPLNLDTSNVVDMSYMFHSATSFNQPVNFNTGKVLTMTAMFGNASVFNQPINFDTLSLTQAESMFGEALAFNSPVNFTTTFNLVRIPSMFASAISFNQPITFRTDSVTDMAYMFYYASSYNQPFASNFNTGQVLYMPYMFASASAFNQPLNFNTSSLQNTDFMFWEATAFNSAINFTSALSLVSVRAMFLNATSFNQPVQFDTNNSLVNVESMFLGATAFNNTVNLTSTRGVDQFESMFMNAAKFNRPVSFQTDSATDMRSMFSGATSFNQPVNFTTSNVTTMEGMFERAASFNQAINFQADNLLSTANMFADAVSFNQPVVLWNTQLVTSTANMFANASNFNSTVNMSSTANVTNMNFMFWNAGRFEQGLATWNTEAVLNCSNFCEYCGLPSFPQCTPCGTAARRVSPKRGSVCNCPAVEPNCELDLCKLFQVTDSLVVECLAPTPTPRPSAPSPSSVIIISPLFNITRGEGNGSSGFVFTLPIDPRAYTELGKVAYEHPCGSMELSCEWQDPQSLQFRQSGCAVTKSMVDMGSGVVGAECTCSHLTVFAIALRSAQHLAPLCHASDVDYVLLSLYSLLAACLLIQLTRLTLYKLYKRAKASLLQHSLLLLACVLRVVFISVKPVIESLAGLVMLALLPSAISLILFIYLMLAWTSLQLMTLNTSPFARFRIPFLMIVIAVLILIVALVIAVAATPNSDDKSAQLAVVLSGSYVLAALYAVVCALVLLAGLGLRRTLSEGASDTLTSLNWRAMFRWRVLVATSGLSSCLLVSACLWVAAVQADIIISDAATLATTAAFYVSDWLSLCVLTWLLSNVISRKQNKKNAKLEDEGVAMK